VATKKSTPGGAKEKKERIRWSRSAVRYASTWQRDCYNGQCPSHSAFYTITSGSHSHLTVNILRCRANSALGRSVKTRTTRGARASSGVSMAYSSHRPSRPRAVSLPRSYRPKASLKRVGLHGSITRGSKTTRKRSPARPSKDPADWSTAPLGRSRSVAVLRSRPVCTEN
jgi:hypothetical protein